jgi:hypothetical protein
MRSAGPRRAMPKFWPRLRLVHFPGRCFLSLRTQFRIISSLCRGYRGKNSPTWASAEVPRRQGSKIGLRNRHENLIRRYRKNASQFVCFIIAHEPWMIRAATARRRASDCCMRNGVIAVPARTSAVNLKFLSICRQSVRNFKIQKPH